MKNSHIYPGLPVDTAGLDGPTPSEPPTIIYSFICRYRGLLTFRGCYFMRNIKVRVGGGGSMFSLNNL